MTELNLYDKSLIRKLNSLGYNSATSIKTLIIHRLRENLTTMDKQILLSLLGELGVEVAAN